MDSRAAQTVREIERTRDRLESNLHELESRLPAAAQSIRAIGGILAGSGAGGTVFWFAVRQMRKRRARKREEEARRTVVNVVPAEWIRAIERAAEDGKWRGWAAGIVAAWLLVRLAELRELRRMKSAMLARS
jgi:flagellar biosynthesis/type III secretory pathway M-ring protein FliF/YscJ